MITIPIKVTAAHIQRGRGGVANSCPVARAMRDAGFKRPSVDIDGALVRGTNTVRSIIDIPRLASRFIVRFDTHGKSSVKPFSFNIRLTNQQALQLGFLKPKGKSK